MILIGENGDLLEGLISNVFVVVNGVVHTAGEHVLKGHAREAVLSVCRANDIPIKVHFNLLFK